MIAIPFLIIFSSLNSTISDHKFYKKEFQKYEIYADFPDQDIDKISLNMISYLKDKEQINESFYNRRELMHLSDVKSLVKKSTSISYAILVIYSILVIFLLYKKEHLFLGKALIYGSAITLLLLLILLALISTNFDNAFINFHLALFSNDYWLLNPDTDNLIKLFPQEFFIDASKKIIMNSIISATIFAALGLFLIKYRKKQAAEPYKH